MPQASLKVSSANIPGLHPRPTEPEHPSTSSGSPSQPLGKRQTVRLVAGWSREHTAEGRSAHGSPEQRRGGLRSAGRLQREGSESRTRNEGRAGGGAGRESSGHGGRGGWQQIFLILKDCQTSGLTIPVSGPLPPPPNSGPSPQGHHLFPVPSGLSDHRSVH